MIGSHAAEFYAKQGHTVIAVDNLMRSRLFNSSKQSVEYNWQYLKRYPRVRRVVGDVRDSALLARLLSPEVDAVIHAAGQTGVRYSLENPSDDFSINALGTFTVLEAVRQRCPKARMVFCSTNKVYGHAIDTIPLREESTRYKFVDYPNGISEEFPVDRTAHTPYGASKYTGDLYVQEYAHTYGLATAVFRMSCIYGTRQFGFEDQGWVAWFTIRALTGQPITIYGDGKQVRDVLFVEDLIQAYDCFLRGNLPHGVYNMGGGSSNTLSLLELLAHLEALGLTRPPIDFKGWRLFDQKVYISDIRSAKKHLRWGPTTSVRVGLKRLVEWARENKFVFDELEAPRA
ncbi:MAG: CDP-paratose 2-epimerase [Berkelbacteria bacterium GW2011_GWA1_36_9]|uniref:CDP-paratose 2-epimerase n=1 Tax=Berkelbacteria bacterium GW2011_GWA1_36_9 TaxID=1618331 RepID=A0A0G0I1Q9_9BACT|nr:MAG: CDP-paratose 2-epimerase [Berkelbacteria bacterium GW2011_GWA1_36_9]